MPRALLLKKTKFNEEGEENNIDLKQYEFSETKSPVEIKRNELCISEKTDPKEKTGKDLIFSEDPLKTDLNNAAKLLKKRKKRIKGYKSRRKMKADNKVTTANNGRSYQKRTKSLKKKNDLAVKIKEDEIFMTDELEACSGQQHFVKWIKKDGKTFRIWECGICHKEFMHQYTLMRHLPIHTDERNFKCDVCQKAFRQASTLCRHKAIHSDARPFLCIVCGKAFNRSSTLIAHRKTHSEHKPYVCHVCGKGFHQKGNLKNHIYTHTGERPYRCDKCERGFNQMSNLMCHKAHAHVERPKYTCHLCGKEFPRKFSLRSHEEYKHGIKYDITGEQPLDVAASKFKEIMEQRLKLGRPTNRNFSKTITLPNGDKTIKFANKVINHEAESNNVLKLPNESVLRSGEKEMHLAEEIIEKSVITDTLTDDLLSKEIIQSKTISSSSESFPRTTGILIDPINTPAMITTMHKGQMPFALLKPSKGIPVLVKILPTTDGKQVLVPATAEDLRSAGKITVSPVLGQTNGATLKAVQIKVPVVATVSQKLSSNGQLIIEIEAVECLQDYNEEVIEQQISTIIEEHLPYSVEESVISIAELSLTDRQNSLVYSTSDDNVSNNVCEEMSGVDQLQVNQSIELVTEDESGVHLSCADALATLSTSAINIESSDIKLTSMGKNVSRITFESSTTNEVIRNVIENLNKLNNLSAS